MKFSDAIDKLIPALGQVSQERLTALKNKANPHLKSKYADLSSVYEVAMPAMQKAGLVAVTTTNTETADLVGVSMRLIHAVSGQWVEGSTLFKIPMATPQAVGSAITYGRRYLMLTMLNMVADDETDDDGHNGTKQPGDKAPARRQVPPKSKADDPRQYLVKLIGEWSGVAAEDRVSAARSARPLLSKKLNLPASDWTPEQVDTAVKFVQDQITRGYDFSEWMAAMAL